MSAAEYRASNQGCFAPAGSAKDKAVDAVRRKTARLAIARTDKRSPARIDQGRRMLGTPLRNEVRVREHAKLNGKKTTVKSHNPAITTSARTIMDQITGGSPNVEVTGDPLEAACGAWHVCDLINLGLP